jgi:hypothetical protein
MASFPKIDKSVLGVAGEFMVAAELCRRNIYTQPTFGHQKRMDLLAFGPGGRMLRIEVKSKQDREWPQCRGIVGPDVYLVFVDFEKRLPQDRPDFFVLSSLDWLDTITTARDGYITKHPDRRAIITDENLLRLPDEVNAKGQEYVGFSVRPENIQDHKEAWTKIDDALNARREIEKAVATECVP